MAVCNYYLHIPKLHSNLQNIYTLLANSIFEKIFNEGNPQWQLISEPIEIFSISIEISYVIGNTSFVDENYCIVVTEKNSNHKAISNKAECVATQAHIEDNLMPILNTIHLIDYLRNSGFNEPFNMDAAIYVFKNYKFEVISAMRLLIKALEPLGI